jgi:peptidoglycan/LPS O-acetylase OafA/YrhL
LSRLATFPATYLALSCPVFAARAWLIQRDLASPLVGAPAWALAATGSLLTWLITFGFLGLALVAFNRPRPVIRYLADSSYWIYLCHLPIVGLLQVDLFPVQASALVKFLIVLTVTLGMGLASYHVFVRYTFLGTWLHGRRTRPSPATIPGPGIPARRTQSAWPATLRPETSVPRRSWLGRPVESGKEVKSWSSSRLSVSLPGIESVDGRSSPGC